MNSIKEKRSSLRVRIKRLNSIIPNAGKYVVVSGDDKPIITKIEIVDISPGGLCIESKYNLKLGVAFDLEILKIKNIRS